MCRPHKQNFLSFLIWRKISFHFGVIFGIVKSTRGRKIWWCRFPFIILSMPIINRDSHHPYFVDSDHKMIPYNVSIKKYYYPEKVSGSLFENWEFCSFKHFYNVSVYNQLFQMDNVRWVFIGELKGKTCMSWNIWPAV